MRKELLHEHSYLYTSLNPEEKSNYLSTLLMYFGAEYVQSLLRYIVEHRQDEPTKTKKE